MAFENIHSYFIFVGNKRFRDNLTNYPSNNIITCLMTSLSVKYTCKFPWSNPLWVFWFHVRLRYWPTIWNFCVENFFALCIIKFIERRDVQRKEHVHSTRKLSLLTLLKAWQRLSCKKYEFLIAQSKILLFYFKHMF